eukprot:m.26350 g.26350  ORF g.26350 m.26350 type:complete len:473 (+) comp11692_c0_seq1:80-1498(+)
MLRLATLLRDQLRLGRELYSDDRFRVVLIAIWTASFGGALHAPVTSYFYLRLGASDTDVGLIGSVISVGSLFSAAGMGWVLDRKGSYPVLFWSCFLCAVGCLIRGMATTVPWLFVGGAVLGLGAGSLWTTGLVYLVSNTPEARRPQIVSCYLSQVAALRIAGKMCYPAWHVLLVNVFGIQPGLFMDRLSMGTCTLFCVYGSVLLGFKGQSIADTEKQRLQPKSCELGTSTTDPLKSSTSTSESMDHAKDQSKTPVIGIPSVWVLGFALFLQAVALNGMTTIWPLLLRDWYQWGSKEFSVALLLCSIVATVGVAAVPSLERSMSRRALGLLVALVLTVSPWLAGLHSSTIVGIAVHVLASSLVIVAAVVLEPIIKSSAAQMSAPGLQGKMFGTLATITGIGEALGSMLLTRLLARSSTQVKWLGITPLIEPLMLISFLGVLLTIVLAYALRKQVGTPIATGLLVPRAFDSKTA